MYSELIRNVVYISNQLVVLQTLRAGYKLEIECSNPQTIKNFRSNALLGSVKLILEDLEPLMYYLADCENGSIPIDKEQLPHIQDLIKSLTEVYNWTLQEDKLKKSRLALMQLETEWAKGIKDTNKNDKKED